MQISDMLGQYNRNVTNGTDELKSAQGTQKLVSTVGELSAGNIFEGTVNGVKGGRVTLALGNGQLITARLEGKVDIRPGSSMFFQVKSNDGTTVSIRPYTGPGNASNPILTNALTAAQVPVTERTLMMVDAMMQEQMPISRQSVLNMAKILTANPQTNVQTLVQMTKLGLPVTEEMASQFERYLTDRHALFDEMELLVSHLTEALAGEELTPGDAAALFDRLADIFLQEETAAQKPDGMPAEMPEEAHQPDGSAAGGAGDTAGANRLAASDLLTGEPAGSAGVQTDPSETGVQTGLLAGEEEAAKGLLPGNGGAAIGSLLSAEQQAALARALYSIPALAGNPNLFSVTDPEAVYVDTMSEGAEAAGGNAEAGNGMETVMLRENLTAEEFVSALKNALAESGRDGLSGLQKLFGSREFQTVFRGMIERQWLLTPEDLRKENKISDLYERLDRQVRQMEAAIKLTGGTGQSSFLQAAADVRGNLEFMNQMNQIYNYVQLPLKLSGQHANGELYVYTNKKNLRDPDAELSAFLHLDLDNLGSTDVSVRMKNRQVKANFYMDDDASYDMIRQHLPILEKRIIKKGYHCQITITNEKKNVSFKENFVKHGRSVPSGGLHRYSFDVRA